MHTRDQGQPLRDALQSADLSIAQLAALTTQVDPEGRGIKKSTIGNLVSTGTSARTTCSRRTARLISAALDRNIEDLFATPPAS